MSFTPYPFPWTCFDGTLCDAFDCFYDIETCVNTGPDSAFLGRGFLSTEGVDRYAGMVRAFLQPCVSGPAPVSLFQIPGEAVQYLDTDTAVDVYGTVWCCWAQGIWLLSAQVVEPHSCIVAVEEKTWAAAKALYRD